MSMDDPNKQTNVRKQSAFKNVIKKILIKAETFLFPQSCMSLQIVKLRRSSY